MNIDQKLTALYAERELLWRKQGRRKLSDDEVVIFDLNARLILAWLQLKETKEGKKK
jgi:hypothetical protein